MARDRSTTLKVVIAGDASQGVKALRDLDRQMKQTDDSVKRSARGVETSLRGVETQAKRTSLRGALGGSASGGFRNIAEAGLQGSVNPLTSFQSAGLAQLGGAEKLLSGISTKTLAVGAGLTVAGVAAAKFGQVSVRNFQQAASAVDNFQDVTGATAEESSKLVFMADRLGIGSDQLAGAMAKLAKGANANQEKFASYGVQLARTSTGAVDLAGTLGNIADAYSGMTNPTRQAEVASLAFGKSWADMTDILEQGGDGIRRLGEEAAAKAPLLSDADLETSREFARTIQEVELAFKRVTVEVGAGLAPALTDVLAIAVPVLQVVEKLQDVKNKLGFLKYTPLGNPALGLTLAGKAIGHFTDKSDEASSAVNSRFVPATLRGSAMARRWVGGVREAASATTTFGMAAGSAATSTERAASAFAGFTAATQDIRTMRETTTGYVTALEALDDLQSSTASSGQSYARALESSNESIVAAEESLNDAYRAVGEASAGLAKAREAAAEQIQDAEAAAADAAREFAEVQMDAAEQVAEAEEDASKRVVDAQQRVIDVRERADRQVRDAADRLEDARQAAADALVGAVGEDNPYEAQRRREEAIKDLQRAERDYGETTTDARKDVAEAEDDAAETQREAAESVQKAHEQAAEQIEAASKRVADAQAAVAEAHQSAAEQITSAQASVVDAQRGAERSGRDLERAMRDAARAQDDAAASAAQSAPKIADVDSKMQGLVDSTFREVFQMRQLGASSDETQPKLAVAEQKIRDTAAALGWSEQKTADYIRQLHLIPTQVATWVTLTMDISQFSAAMRTASLQLSGLAREWTAAGIVEFPGMVPRFHEGGMFHAPPGRSEGLAMLHDREAVFTPEQIAALGSGGGSGTTVVVQGSLITERDLMDIIARAQRRGYRG